MWIIENDKARLQEFVNLNEEWISTYFEHEDADRALAANPYKVIEDGGYIFSLIAEGKTMGVCALFNEGNGTYELARMAVSPDAQGNGYGNKLIEACFTKLNDLNANKVYLATNTKLEAAVALYKKFGFNSVFEGVHPHYSRANLVMECKTF